MILGVNLKCKERRGASSRFFLNAPHLSQTSLDHDEASNQRNQLPNWRATSSHREQPRALSQTKEHQNNAQDYVATGLHVLFSTATLMTANLPVRIRILERIIHGMALLLSAAGT
jgi:hypothetical protein